MSVTLLEEVTTDGARAMAELALSTSPDADVSDAQHNSTCLLHDEPPPPLPAGFAVGTRLYYAGPSFTSSNNNWLVHGAQGEVVGPASSQMFKGKGVAVRFRNNVTTVECLFEELVSREPPPLPSVGTVGRWAGRGC